MGALGGVGDSAMAYRGMDGIILILVSASDTGSLDRVRLAEILTMNTFHPARAESALPTFSAHAYSQWGENQAAVSQSAGSATSPSRTGTFKPTQISMRDNWLVC